MKITLRINSFSKKVLISILLPSVVGFFIPITLYSWSSKSGVPLFEPVHQIAIQNVLSGKVSLENLNILQHQQIIVDQDQDTSQSFEHAMTGIKSGQQVNIERQIFIQKSNDFVKDNLSKAIKALKNKREKEAYEYLGNAIHTLEDGTSPAHEPFQTWSDSESYYEKAIHVFKERIYPDDKSDKDQAMMRARLEGVVMWAYDIFIGKVFLPNTYFDSNGHLVLPLSYLKYMRN